MKNIVELVQERLAEEGAEGTEEELIALAQSYVEQAAQEQGFNELNDDQLDTIAGGVGLASGKFRGFVLEEAEEAVKGLGNFRSGKGFGADRVKIGNF